jgi:hypothetical protein
MLQLLTRSFSHRHSGYAKGKLDRMITERKDRFYCATAMWFLCSCLKFVRNRDCVASLLGLDYAIATWLSRPHTVASQAQNQTWEAGICGYELWGSSELSYGYHCHSINGIHIPCFAWPRSYRLSIHMKDSPRENLWFYLPVSSNMICWKTPAKHGWLPERKEHNVHSMREQ